MLKASTSEPDAQEPANAESNGDRSPVTNGQEPNPSKLGVSLKKKKVLVIDDEDDVRLVVSTRLQRAGYDTVSASNGRDGLSRFYADKPDLVILDVSMPEMDGWQVLDCIREVSDLPVVMLTAAATEKDKIKGLNWGADDYITKPFSGGEFLARVGAAIRRSTTATATESIGLSEGDSQKPQMSTNSALDVERSARSLADTPEKPVSNENIPPVVGDAGVAQLPQMSEMGIDVFFNAKHVLTNEFDGEIHAHSWRLRAVILTASNRDASPVGVEKLRDSVQEVADEIEGV